MLAQYGNNFEIPNTIPSNQSIVQKIEALMDEILAAKKDNHRQIPESWRWR